MKAIVATLLVMTATPVGTAQAQPVTIRPGPHWMPALQQDEVVTFRCRNGSLVRARFREVFQPGRPAERGRRQLLSLTLNEVPVGRQAVEDLNTALRGFAREPVFSPQCVGNRYRVNLYLVENGRATDGSYIMLVTDNG